MVVMSVLRIKTFSNNYHVCIKLWTCKLQVCVFNRLKRQREEKGESQKLMSLKTLESKDVKKKYFNKTALFIWEFVLLCATNMYHQQVKAVLAKQTACVISTSVHAYSSTLKSDILSRAQRENF